MSKCPEVYPNQRKNQNRLYTSPLQHSITEFIPSATNEPRQFVDSKDQSDSSDIVLTIPVTIRHMSPSPVSLFLNILQYLFQDIYFFFRAQSQEDITLRRLYHSIFFRQRSYQLLTGLGNRLIVTFVMSVLTVFRQVAGTSLENKLQRYEIRKINMFIIKVADVAGIMS